MENLSKQEIKLQSLIKSDEQLKKAEKIQRVTKVLYKILTYAFLLLVAVIIVFPFYWMIISSLKTQTEYYFSPPTFVPGYHEVVLDGEVARRWGWGNIDWKNYIESMKEADFSRYMINTVIVGLVSTVLSMFVTIFAAFAFSRLKFKGRETLFSILLATMMIPGEMFTVTNYTTVSALGWKNTYIVLIVPFLVSVFYIYLLRQNFKQIPDSLYYAAKVDGTSDMKYLFKVMIPLASPTIISIIIMKMMGAWNSYLWPRLVADEDSFRLITNGLREAFTVEPGQQMDYPLQMAAVTIVSIPLFLVFAFFRKYIMRGVARTGTKG